MMGWLITVLLSLFHTEPERCVASVFAHAGDRWAGGPSKCLGRKVRPGDWGVAHRTLPCGSLVLLSLPRTGKIVVAPVVDAGPYGALLNDGTWVLKLRRSDPGRYRGCLDLTPPVSAALSHGGFEPVSAWVLPSRFIFWESESAARVRRR